MARVAFLRVQPVLNTHTNTQSSSYLLLFRSMCANNARRYFPKRAVCTYCCYCCAICCVCVCGVFCFADKCIRTRVRDDSSITWSFTHLSEIMSATRTIYSPIPNTRCLLSPLSCVAVNDRCIVIIIPNIYIYEAIDIAWKIFAVMAIWRTSAHLPCIYVVLSLSPAIS